MGEPRGDRATKRDEFEPADRPVRASETLLCLAWSAAFFSVYWWHLIVAEVIAGVLAGALVVVALVTLLVPRPRLSATRGAHVLLGLLTYVLLSDQNWLRR